MKKLIVLVAVLSSLVGCKKETHTLTVSKTFTAYGGYFIVGDTIELGIDKNVNGFDIVVTGKDIFTNNKMVWYSSEKAHVNGTSVVVYDKDFKEAYTIEFIDTNYNSPRIEMKGKIYQLKRFK